MNIYIIVYYAQRINCARNTARGGSPDMAFRNVCERCGRPFRKACNLRQHLRATNSRCKRGMTWDGFILEFVDETLACQKGCLAEDGQSRQVFSNRSALIAHYRGPCPGMREARGVVSVDRVDVSVNAC